MAARITRDDLLIRQHAAARMAERGIVIDEVLAVLNDGDIISAPDAKRQLWLGFPGGRAMHVATMRAATKWVIYTVYEPDPARWTNARIRKW